MRLKSLTTLVRNVVAIGLLTVIGYILFIASVPGMWQFSLHDVLDGIEHLSWIYVYSSFGLIASLALSQLLYYRDFLPKKQKFKLSTDQGYLFGGAVAFFTMVATIGFTILAYMSNRSFFYPGAIVVGIMVMASMTVLIYCVKRYKIAIALPVLGVAYFLCVQPHMPAEVDKVAQQYAKEFKDLGYIGFYQHYDPLKMEKKQVLAFRRDKQVLEGKETVALFCSSDLPICKQFMDYYSNMELKLVHDKLYISKLELDIDKVSPAQLAQELDGVMQQVLMPRLRQESAHYNP